MFGDAFAPCMDRLKNGQLLWLQQAGSLHTQECRFLIHGKVEGSIGKKCKLFFGPFPPPFLFEFFSKYDRDPRPLLEELPERSLFRFNERIFVKGPQLRKRYKCHCLNDRRTYFIDPLAEVHVHSPITARKAS